MEKKILEEIYQLNLNEKIGSQLWESYSKLYMDFLANYLRERMPPWLLKYLPKWIVNWLYPPIPLYINIYYTRKPYYVLFGVSAVAAAYMIYKTFHEYYSKEVIEVDINRNHKLLHLSTAIPHVLIVPQPNLDVPSYNLSDSNRKSSDEYVKVNRNESFNFGTEFEDPFNLESHLYRRRHMETQCDDVLVDNLSDYYKFEGSSDNGDLTTLSKSSARKLADCDLQLYHELPF